MLIAPEADVTALVSRPPVSPVAVPNPVADIVGRIEVRPADAVKKARSEAAVRVVAGGASVLESTTGGSLLALGLAGSKAASAIGPCVTAALPVIAWPR